MDELPAFGRGEQEALVVEGAYRVGAVIAVEADLGAELVHPPGGLGAAAEPWARVAGAAATL